MDLKELKLTVFVNFRYLQGFQFSFVNLSRYFFIRYICRQRLYKQNDSGCPPLL